MLARDKFLFNGNTPTCVGKTGGLPEKTPLEQKHPHVRGEDTLPFSQ